MESATGRLGRVPTASWDEIASQTATAAVRAARASLRWHRTHGGNGRSGTRARTTRSSICGRVAGRWSSAAAPTWCGQQVLAHGPDLNDLSPHRRGATPQGVITSSFPTCSSCRAHRVDTVYHGTFDFSLNTVCKGSPQHGLRVGCQVLTLTVVMRVGPAEASAHRQTVRGRVCGEAAAACSRQTTPGLQAGQTRSRRPAGILCSNAVTAARSQATEQRRRATPAQLSRRACDLLPYVSRVAAQATFLPGDATSVVASRPADDSPDVVLSAVDLLRNHRAMAYTAMGYVSRPRCMRGDD